MRLWKWRPFTRIVVGWRAFLTARHYLQLNELEATGRRAYRKTRLAGLSTAELQALWDGS